MDNSAFGIPEQRAALDNLENTEPRSRQSQMDAYSKETKGFIEISLEKPTSTSTQLAQRP